MKICCRWNNDLRHERDFDELIIQFKMSALSELVVFLKEHYLQQIILEISDLQSLVAFPKIFKDLKEKYFCTNFTIRFPDLYSIAEKDLIFIREHFAGIPYYFNTLVNNWDMVWRMIQEQVSDIMIVEELGFCTDKVRAAVGENMKIRVYPNVAQSKDPLNGFPQFYIRPEGMMLYDEYVDVLEIFQYPIDSKEFNKTNPDVLYESYMRDGEWFGPLDEIIIGIPEQVEGASLPPQFDVYRVTCGKKCTNRTIKRRCNFCKSCIELSKVMDDNDLIFS